MTSAGGALRVFEKTSVGASYPAVIRFTVPVQLKGGRAPPDREAFPGTANSAAGSERRPQEGPAVNYFTTAIIGATSDDHHGHSDGVSGL